MGCNCTDKIRQDFNYIRKLANAFGTSNKKNVQVYAFYIGLTKYYDFDELPTREKRAEIVEIIQFQQHESTVILQYAEKTGAEVNDKVKTGKLPANRGNGKKGSRKVATDTGKVLPKN